MTAPERIWAWETLNCNGQWTIAEGDGIEYLRADLADTATWNAAIREAAELLGEAAKNQTPARAETVKACGRAILALLKDEK